MINTTNVLGKDNPRWPIGNATETIQVLGAGTQVPRGHAPDRHGRALPRTGTTGRPAIVVAGAFRTAAACVAVWLTGLLRRAGGRLFAMNDAEAGWRGWQLTVLNGGLARQYRDGRFDEFRDQLEPHAGRVELNAEPGTGSSGRPLDGEP